MVEGVYGLRIPRKTRVVAGSVFATHRKMLVVRVAPQELARERLENSRLLKAQRDADHRIAELKEEIDLLNRVCGPARLPCTCVGPRDFYFEGRHPGGRSKEVTKFQVNLIQEQFSVSSESVF